MIFTIIFLNSLSSLCINSEIPCCIGVKTLKKKHSYIRAYCLLMALVLGYIDAIYSVPNLRMLSLMPY